MDEVRGWYLIIALFCFAGAATHFFIPATSFNENRYFVMVILTVIFGIMGAWGKD